MLYGMFWGTKRKFIESKIVSRDGTPISLYSTGEGPGLLVVHGQLGTSKQYRRLALALADRYTVHLIDRRGRGLSGPQGEAYSIAKECEDVAAILLETGSAFVFGHSYGGLVGLETALAFPLAKLAVYEPGLSVHGSIPHGWLDEFRRAMDRQDYAEALVLIIRGLRLISPLHKIPRKLLKFLIRWTVVKSEWNETVSLLHTLEPEIREVQRLDSCVEKYKQVSTATLILVGRESPAYMHEAAQSLTQAVPASHLHTFSNLNHLAPVSYHPRLLARTLKNFFIFTK